ncbi:MAG: VIT1/CCC1 transporter family protein [Steroidobacteraceae bacterium]
MSWFEEKQSAWLYRRAAQVEPDKRISQLFKQLADGADEQAAIWNKDTSAVFSPGLRARVVAGLLGIIPPRRLRPVLAAMKLRGFSAYDSHSQMRASGHAMPTTLTEVGASHNAIGGGNLRAAVFGVNDGLVSNTCLIMGVAGASVGNQPVLTAGLAGLLAGALSMAAGEYISMRSQREMYEYQIGLERAELAEYPEEEIEELALIYAARGMELSRAREFATEMMSDPQHALDVLSREELGLNPDDLGSPWGAALFSFVAFALGAAIPLLPFLMWLGEQTLLWSCVVASISLYGVGMALSLFTGRGAWLSGLRMLAIGAAAGVITFYIGRWLGAVWT